MFDSNTRVIHLLVCDPVPIYPSQLLIATNPCTDFSRLCIAPVLLIKLDAVGLRRTLISFLWQLHIYIFYTIVGGNGGT